MGRVYLERTVTGRKRVGTFGPKMSHNFSVLIFLPPKNTMPLFFTTPQNMKALFRQLINKLEVKIKVQRIY